MSKKIEWRENDATLYQEHLKGCLDRLREWQEKVVVDGTDDQELDRLETELDSKTGKDLSFSSKISTLQAENKVILKQAADTESEKERDKLTATASQNISQIAVLQTLSMEIQPEIDALVREIGHLKSRGLWPFKHMLDDFLAIELLSLEEAGKDLIIRMEAYQAAIPKFIGEVGFKIDSRERQRYLRVRVPILEDWT